MNNLSLYNLSQEYQSLLCALYNPETGEVDEVVEAKLNELLPSIQNRCIAFANFIKKMEAEKREIDFYKEEILKRESAYEAAIIKYKERLQKSMEHNRIDEIKCPYFTLRIKTNPYSTDIFDESQIPEEYMRTREIVKTEVKADKTAIKEAVLKSGVQVPGAKVYQKTQLQILTDKI